MDTKRPGASARSPQDIVGGLFLVAIAALALYLVNHLPATGRVGFASGTAPRLFAYGLLGLGVWIAIAGFFTEGPGIGSFNWRGLVTILGSVVLFAVGIRYVGLALIGVPMVMLASLADDKFKFEESLYFGIGMTAFCGLLFPTILGQPIPLWPPFLDMSPGSMTRFIVYAIASIAVLGTAIYVARQMLTNRKGN
ncbi:MAG: tripartite tricarboxylate transporter TctB family protein [Rhabdaerophilum sp.]